MKETSKKGHDMPKSKREPEQTNLTETPEQKRFFNNKRENETNMNKNPALRYTGVVDTQIEMDAQYKPHPGQVINSEGELRYADKASNTPAKINEANKIAEENNATQEAKKELDQIKSTEASPTSKIKNAPNPVKKPDEPTPNQNNQNTYGG